MRRRIAHAIFAAAAAGAVVAGFGLAAAGTAAATSGPRPVVYNHAGWTAGTATGARPAVFTNHFAGYATALLENWRFRSVAATVPVAACRIGPNKNPSAVAQLVGGTKWTADISVFCNGGRGSVIFFDQKSAATHAQGAFRLSPRVGDRLRISVNRNVPGHQDSFTVTDLRTGQSQTVRITTSAAVVYRHALLASAVARNADVMPLPATTKLLWTFRNSRVVTYNGVVGTLHGPWTTVKVIDRTSGGVIVMFPGNLSSSGAAFSTFLHAR
jgi:hypothetical protein